MIRRKKLLSLVLIVITIYVLSSSGCSDKQAAKPEAEKPATPETSKTVKEGGSIIVAISTEPDHLDPYLATSADTRSMLFNVFEGLVKPDKDGNLIPAVAESMPIISSDFLTYTFKVRNGIKFHNGNPVTSTDIKYSLDTAIADKIPGLTNIKSVVIIDSVTVKITLNAPDNDFLPYLTIAIIPKDYKDQNTKPIGTGPFSFDSFKPQQALVLKKNTLYWQKGLPHLDKVTFKIEADSNVALLDLQSGSIDLASIADDSVAKQLTAGYNIIQDNSNAVQQLNLNESFKPFSDVKVRQAISYVVDPDEIINTVNFGKGTRVGTPIIPGLKNYSDTTLTNAYKKDINKAKQLLNDAGYGNNLKFTITVPSNYKVHVDTAQVIVNQLKEIGVTADIKQVDWPTWISKVYTGKEYEATIISVDGANLSPKSFLARYVSNGQGNFFNYNSKDFDAAYDAASKESDVNKKIELFKKAQQIISKDAANVFIQDIASLTAMKKNLAGRVSYPMYVTDVSTIYDIK